MRSPTTRSGRCACPGARRASKRTPGPTAPGPAHAPRAARRRGALVARRAVARTCSRPRPRPRTRIALQLLERHGVVTREGVRAEGRHRVASPACTPCCARSKSPGGRGAAGSSPASAPRSSRLPGAVDRLRAHRTVDARRAGRASLVLAATDPAQPYGAALAWPEHVGRGPARRARPARSSCSSTARASRTSNAAARRSLTFARRAATEPDAWAERARRGAQGGPASRGCRSSASTTSPRARRRTLRLLRAGRIRRRLQGPHAESVTRCCPAAGRVRPPSTWATTSRSSASTASLSRAGAVTNGVDSGRARSCRIGYTT